MIRILAEGNWSQSQLSLSWIASTRQLVPQVQTAIDQAWTNALARPGVHLFDGPMCRMESWRTTEDRLELTLSTSSYKIFLGTNMTHPEFAKQYGPTVMGNPVGVSPALLTADQYLLLGRRTSAVAYYPNRIHPFSGCLEPKDADPFAAVAREMSEELALQANDIANIRCIGIAEDENLIQPELIFAAQTIRMKQEVEARLDQLENRSVFAVAATAAAIEAAVKEPQLTPVAVASLQLWGRLNFGQDWFNQMRRA